MATYVSTIHYRVTEDDRLIFRELAMRLQRSESDAVRMVVRQTVAVLREQDEQKQQAHTARPRTSRRGA